MRPMTQTVLAGLVALLASSAALAEVTVTYVKPDDYVDLPFSPIERERTLKEFSDYFATLDKKLPQGQTLKIEVLDIDLAGRLYPRRAGDDIRVMTGGADWPRVHLRYTLEQDGQVLRSGDDEISNMNYQWSRTSYSDSDAMRYEKQMLDDWFKKTIVPKMAQK
ncbi:MULTISPECIES: DUF3016 domain-containing protein [unclassified Duganella]|uniref:DUF3016 domain-containing protein n=1 Tax=unclassified Duganella TaxID=2636909 RepID=UPI00088D123F|nr:MULTISPECIES: DUF3016 domain-containing protein [unclassified Duganella]SDH16801.1 Protein of unknown function [Duganella sp. OV458]SDK31356.1 Protein of unknown function [Duganella sp. OV510]